MKVIYLVRDVRDVLLSEYRAHIRNGVFIGSLDDYLGPFLRGRVNYFGSWAQHVDFWIAEDGASSTRGERLVMTFEELRRDPQESLESAMGFLGVEVPRSTVARAVSNNSLESMKAREDAAPPGVIDHTVAGERFVGEGSAGGWLNKLTDDQLDRVESTAGTQLVRCGYRLGR